MSARPYITCREVIAFIGDYLDHVLNLTQLEDFDRHLAVCASCRAYLATYRVTVRAVRDLDAPDEETPEDLIRAILEARGR